MLQYFYYYCRNFSGAQLQWESVATSATRSQAATQQQQQQQQNHANHSQSKSTRVTHADDQSDVKLVVTAVAVLDVARFRMRFKKKSH